MNEDEYKFYKDILLGDSEVASFDLLHQQPRTLLYGYTVERNNFHVYFSDGFIHRAIYEHPRELIDHVSGPMFSASLLIPDKRAYPQFTDAGFALLLKRRGFSIPFTTYTPTDKKGPFYAEVW